MNKSKNIVQSKTIQGVFITYLIAVMPMIQTLMNGYDADAVGQLVAATLTTGYAIYGRYVAESKVHL